jgi:hypothetical protein
MKPEKYCKLEMMNLNPINFKSIVMQDKDKKFIQVYVELLDEGSVAWRPTQAQEIGDGIYKLIPTSNYNPDDEYWAFLPGDSVRLKEANSPDGTKVMLVIHPNPDVIRIDVEQEENDVFGLRGTHALSLGNEAYKILPTPHYNPREQHWKFPPGSIVRLKEISLSGFTFLVPSERIA